jgi:hypothetical protein
MKNIAKVLIVIILAFSVSSCSKDEAKQSENLHKTAKVVPSNKAWIGYDAGHNPHLAFMFLEDLGVKRGETVIVEYDNGSVKGSLTTEAQDGKNLRVESRRAGMEFMKSVGKSEVKVKVVGSNIEVNMDVNGTALMITMKS